MAREMIGIMGGTFDPIHKGHIAMARAAMEAAHLDRVLMLPTGNPPHKTGITPAEDRWRMVCAACVKEPDLEPCRLELDREGVIYTYDTLKLLKQAYPKAQFFYIIGADTLLELKHWHRYEEVLKLCVFIVCPRPWDVAPQAITEETKRLIGLGGKFISVLTEPLDISSTTLRKQLAADEPTPMLPETVREYAHLCGLYGMPAGVERAAEWMPALFAALTVKRFSHTLAVAYTARLLAAQHDVDVVKAETAALLHDCAKCLPLQEMREICVSHHLTEDRSILESGALMHAIAGACLAEEKYGVDDPEILDAINSHTTGRPGMTKLDMVGYLADKIEPTRDVYPTLVRVRMLASLSLYRAMICSMEGTGNYVRKGGKPLHPQSAETLKWLREAVHEA